jgi:hypothetical protein
LNGFRFFRIHPPRYLSSFACVWHCSRVCLISTLHYGQFCTLWNNRRCGSRGKNNPRKRPVKTVFLTSCRKQIAIKTDVRLRMRRPTRW